MRPAHARLLALTGLWATVNSSKRYEFSAYCLGLGLSLVYPKFLCQESFFDVRVSTRRSHIDHQYPAKKENLKTGGVPSWIADWTDNTHSLWLPEDILCRCMSKSVYTGVRAYGMPFYSVEGGTLTVLGRHLYVVAACVRLPKQSSTAVAADSRVLDAIVQWFSLVHPSSNITSDDQSIEHVLDVLYLNHQDMFRGATTKSQGETVQAWYREVETSSERALEELLSADLWDKTPNTKVTMQNLQIFLGGKRLLFITKAGRYGTASLNIREGDVVHLVLGVPTPLCLRKQACGNGYEVVGPAIMNQDSSDDIWRAPLRRLNLI